MTPEQYYTEIKSILLRKGNPETAIRQSKYMRDKFEYIGLKAPEWVAVSKDFFKENGGFDGEELKEFARLCMEDEYREMNYIGLQMVEKKIKKQPEDFIEFLEELVRTRSWWDSVDWINKLVGIHFRRYPQLIVPVTAHWAESDTFWLQRICMIFQLTYKEKTDADLMFRYVKKFGISDEFFLQKGAGWSLRQYSKTAPERVRQFIMDNPQLSRLTQREGMKWILKNT